MEEQKIKPYIIQYARVCDGVTDKYDIVYARDLEMAKASMVAHNQSDMNYRASVVVPGDTWSTILAGVRKRPYILRHGNAGAYTKHDVLYAESFQKAKEAVDLTDDEPGVGNRSLIVPGAVWTAM